DAAVENRLRAKLHHEPLAEVEGLAIEIEKADAAVDAAPVADRRFTAIQSQVVLHDGQAEKPGRERGLILPRDGKRRTGGLQTSGSAVAAWHDFSIGANAAGAVAQPAQHAQHAPRLVRVHVLAVSAPRGRRCFLRPFRRRRLGHHLKLAYDNGHAY